MDSNPEDMAELQLQSGTGFSNTEFNGDGQMLQTVLDSIPFGIYWRDTTEKFLGANRAFIRDYGFTTLKELKAADSILFPGINLDKQVLATGKPVVSPELSIDFPGNIRKTVSFIHVPLRSPQGDVVGVLGTYIDVSENVSFRDQLRQRKNFLARLVEALPVGFFAKDPSSGMSYRIWNRKMEEIFGYSAETAVESRDWNLFGASSAALLEEDDRVLLDSPDSGRKPRIYKLQGANGQRTVSMVRVPLYDDLLDLTLVAGVVDDITRENQLEEQLRQAQKMEAIGRLAGGVAHDFNNLLQVIMGAAEIGLVSTDDQAKCFKQILNAGEKAMFLTRQLLSFSREESFSRRPFDVDHRVGEFIRMVHRIVEENITLEFIPGAPGVQVNGDPFQLEQVLMNLIVNARDALEETDGGEITVSTSFEMAPCTVGADPVECAVLSVSDNGQGIPEKIRDRIFEPFFTTKKEGKGTGLGLASSYAIVTKHHGIINVASTPGSGSRFDVCIPVWDEGEGKTEKTLPRDGEDALKSHLTILLAEDEDMVREIARTVLEKAGHDVLEATDGQMAVDLHSEYNQQIDLAVFDAMMPRMSGRDAFEAILTATPDLPCLFCTGYSGESLLDHFRDRAQVAVLQKPYSASDFLKAVEDLTRRK